MLTSSQHKALNFIREYISRNGYSPSFADIANGLGIKSRGVVHRYVHALANAGYIEISSGRKRSIKLTEDEPENTLPLLGRIAAGQPIEAIADLDRIDLGTELGGKDRYALKVKGDSMIDAGILDGDIVVIKHQLTARNGDIVVALIDDNETTLKRFRQLDDQHVQLTPENSSMEPMIYPLSQVKIQGVVVGQFRTYS